MFCKYIYDCKTGQARVETSDLPPSEIGAMEAAQLEAERSYWDCVPYDEAVNTEIRKRYTESQEFAILRQREEKPEEYAAYYAYCEECKAFVKQKKSLTE